MITYEKMYKRVVKATSDSENRFHDLELSELVRKDARTIGSRCVDSSLGHSLDLAMQNMASQAELVLSNREEFIKEYGLEEYSKYFYIANRLLQQDVYETREPVLV